MVPHDYWMEVQSLRQKTHLTKQPKPPTEEIINDKVSLSEELTLVTYTQADLTQIICNCTDLNIDKQSSLLQILCKHKTLFLGKRGNWKGRPMTIEVIEGDTLVWSKPYPVPLKKPRHVQKRSLPPMLNWSSVRAHSCGDRRA